jgi:hypothetical protein
MAAEAMEARVGRIPPAPVAVSLPLFDQAGFDADGNRIFLADWTPAARWVLDDHRTRAGDALLPGTGYLELIAQAMAAQGEPAAFEIRDLTFLTPLRTPDGTATQVRLTLPRSDAGYAFRIESAPEGGTWNLHAEGEVLLLRSRAAPPRGPRSRPRKRRIWPSGRAGAPCGRWRWARARGWPNWTCRPKGPRGCSCIRACWTWPPAGRWG